MRVLLAFAGALALCPGAQAATYDAFASFNGVQGAGGFRYLEFAGPPGTPPTPLGSNTGCVVTSDFCLQSVGGLPGAYKSLTAFEEGTYSVPNDRLLVHPGPASALGVLFSAPEAGDYDFTATFNVLDDSPTGVFLLSVTNAGGSVATQNLGLINAQNPTITYSGSVGLAQGQFLLMIVNHAGSYSNDSTGFNFTLTRQEAGAVPEPASWAMMILGFGMAGAVARRRAAYLRAAHA